MNPTFKRGTELHHEDRAHVLRAYVHRFTKEHMPNWAREPMSNGNRYMPQFASDADWLEHTFFAVKKDGRLDRRVKACQSNPTWPEGLMAEGRTP